MGISYYPSKDFTSDEAAELASDIIGAAPVALNTLDELAQALNDDANFASTITTQLSAKASTGKAIAMSIVFGG